MKGIEGGFMGHSIYLAYLVAVYHHSNSAEPHRNQQHSILSV